MDQPLTVSTVLTQGRVSLPAEWVWLARDPAAVRLCVSRSPSAPPPRPRPSRENPPERPVPVAVWCCARERLRDALAGRMLDPGHMGFTVWPDRCRALGVQLWTSNGWWRGVTDVRVVTQFLCASYAHVSSEREAVMVASAANRLDPDRLAELEGEAM